jgi:hypothetical protein
MDELGRIMRDSVWISNFSYDANGQTFEIEGFAFKTTEFQRFLMQIYDSKVFINLNLEDKKMENEQQTGTSGTQEYRPRTPPTIGGPRRSIEGPPGLSEGGEGTSNDDSPAMGPRATGESGVYGHPELPEPRYKLPSGPTGWRSIEEFFGPTLWVPDILWKFKISGTVNSELMLVGRTVFGDKVEGFFQTGGAAGAKPTPGGAKPPTPGGAPGSSGSSSPSPKPGG